MACLASVPRRFCGSLWCPPIAVMTGDHEPMNSNAEIVQEVIERVVNQKRIDAWDQYFSQDYIARGAPYVGMGFSVDSSVQVPTLLSAATPPAMTSSGWFRGSTWNSQTRSVSFGWYFRSTKSM